MPMNELTFKLVIAKDCTAREWLKYWAERYDGNDDHEHNELVQPLAPHSAEYFERVGKWKEGLVTEGAINGKWKPNIASVAYEVWMRAAQKPPECPQANEVTGFLDGWADQVYTDIYTARSVTKHFGLSRATTLLHFLSGGQFPIFDSRVREAYRCLSNSTAGESAKWYVDIFCPWFRQLAEHCGTENDLRLLDKALFSYGAFTAIKLRP